MLKPQDLPQKPKSITDFGVEFQQSLIAEIITSHKFGVEIIDLIDKDYFKNNYFGYIVKLIKDYYGRHEVIPSYAGIQVAIDANYGDVPETKKTLTDTLEGIKNCGMVSLDIPQIALTFCKFQKVRNTVDAVKKKLDNGYYKEYDDIEDIIRKAITFKESDEGVDFFSGLDHALDENYREVIPTGIAGIDKITNGGLGRQELAVVIAPLGVGKTTFLSIIGSNAYKSGANVLHIFFEDKLDEVRRKYLCHWSNIPLEKLNEEKEFILRKANEVKESLPNGRLIFEKLHADTVNVAKLRRIIKREKNKLGGKLDMVIIDYADCIVGEQSKDSEEWTGEGKTMRQLEGLAEEFNVAIWTAVQGGRKSTTAAVVEVDMIGGSIKKAQVAHFIMSIAKTLQQRDQKLATIAILKSRFGDDGKVFENCAFNNSRMLIDTTEEESFDTFSANQTHRQSERILEVVAQLRREDAERHAESNKLPVNKDFNKD
jgi:RecA/RadA recombinase